MTIESHTRTLAKWLNEEQTAPIDRVALACVLAAVQQPREWKELTRGEIESWDLPEKLTIEDFVWFVESKIKEKNQ
jgi:hypothetical protein